MMRLETISGPSFLPVSYGDAVDHLRLNQTDDQSRIERLILAAAKYIETTGSVSMAARQYRLYCDAFRSEIELPNPPLASVEAVKYTDDDGVEQTAATSLYTVDAVSAPGVVRLAYGESWPSTRAESGAVRIEYTAGYASQSEIPEDLRLLTLFVVEHWYDNPDQDVPASLTRLFWSVRGAPQP